MTTAYWRYTLVVYTVGIHYTLEVYTIYWRYTLVMYTVGIHYTPEVYTGGRYRHDRDLPTLSNKEQ